MIFVKRLPSDAAKKDRPIKSAKALGIEPSPRSLNAGGDVFYRFPLARSLCPRHGLPRLDSACSFPRNRVGADSLVSRLNNGHRIHIGDFEMRKATAPTTPDD